MAAQINENTQYSVAGSPIVGGSLYIGLKGADPIVSPITIFSDRELTVVLANPQTLDSDGRSPNKIWIPGEYSLRVDDSSAVQQLIDLDAGVVAESGVTGITNVQGTNTITGEGATTITEYVDKELYVFVAANDITGAVTLNWDAVGAKALVYDFDIPLEQNHIKQNQTVIAAWNATTDNFLFVNPNRKVVYGNEGAAIASASTVDLALATGNSIDVSGTTTITSLGTTPDGSVFWLTMLGALIITHNGTSLIIPGGENYTTTAGDVVRVQSLGSGNNSIQIFVGGGAATQAQQETGTATRSPVTPATQQHHPSAAKAWAQAPGAGSGLDASYNMASVTDNSTGDITFNIDTDFSSANFSSLVTLSDLVVDRTSPLITTQTAGTVRIKTFDEAGTQQDPILYFIACFGDQA